MSALDAVLIGKHFGSSHAVVADADRSYCHWVINATSLPRSLKPFREWLRRTYGGVLPCGKYRNGFYSEIHRDHPEYAFWACELKDPSGALLDFQKYVRKREETASEDAAPEQPPPKRARGPPGGNGAPPRHAASSRRLF